MRDTPEIRDLIIGNEPNLNRFWMPQFDADRGDVSPPWPTSRCCSRLRRREAGRPEAARLGRGARAKRGIDRPGTGRDTHSPTTFIRDLGAAYRASGLTEPPLDGFAYHPYSAS